MSFSVIKDNYVENGSNLNLNNTDLTGYLKVNKIIMDGGIIDGTYSLKFGSENLNNTNIDIDDLASTININSEYNVSIGNINNINKARMTISNSDPPEIILESGPGSIQLGNISGLYNGTKIDLYNSYGGGAPAIHLECGRGMTTIGDPYSQGFSTSIDVDDSSGNIENNAVFYNHLNTYGSIKLSTVYHRDSIRLGSSEQADIDSRKYAHVFDGNDLNAILPIIDERNVGVQFQILNVNSTDLRVISDTQNIYFSGDVPSNEKILKFGFCHIFTAVQINDFFGWTMI